RGHALGRGLNRGTLIVGELVREYHQRLLRDCCQLGEAPRDLKTDPWAAAAVGLAPRIAERAVQARQERAVGDAVAYREPRHLRRDTHDLSGELVSEYPRRFTVQPRADLLGTDGVATACQHGLGNRRLNHPY